MFTTGYPTFSLYVSAPPHRTIRSDAYPLDDDLATDVRESAQELFPICYSPPSTSEHIDDLERAFAEEVDRMAGDLVVRRTVLR